MECVPQVCNFIEKETLAQLFSCELCEISKNAYSYRTHPVAASALSRNKRNKRNNKPAIRNLSDFIVAF